MYKIIRRISSSLFSRPDRPWAEDATSNAPQIGQKRRLSSEEPEAQEQVGTLSKRSRRGPAELSEDASQVEDLQSRPDQDTQEVKDVTKGVRGVELNDKDAPESSTSAAADAAAVPLPNSPVLEAIQASQAAAVPLPESPVLEATQESKDAEDIPAAQPLEEHAVETDKDAEGEMEDASGEAVVEEGSVKEQEESKYAEQVLVSSAVEELSDATQSAVTDRAVDKAEGVTASATQ